MKRLLPVFFCLLLFCSAAMAQLNGSDNFNDNIRDSSKWLVEVPQLNETNGRLEYSSSGSGEEQGIWAWALNSGSYTQSWSVTMDAFNLLDPSVMLDQGGGILLYTANSNNIYGDCFAIGFFVGEEDGPYRVAMSGGDTGGSNLWVNPKIVSVDTNQLVLRISYDAATETLFGSYSEGGGFTTITNFNVSSWGMDDDGTFIIAIVCSSESLAVSSGQVYADNFQAITEPGISNHVSFVVINSNHDYDDPFNPDDDQYEIDIEAITDATVTNVTFTTPANETLGYTERNVEDESIEWEYWFDSDVPLTNRFGDGDYIVTVTYSNGTSESTVIPFAEEDGITPLTGMSMQPLFSSPNPLHNKLFCSTTPHDPAIDITLEWNTIDPQANVTDIWLWKPPPDEVDENLGLFADHVPFSTGPFSTRSVGPISITQGVWEVEFFFGNATYQTNSDGVVYVAVKGAESDYSFTILSPQNDEDADGIPNWWESLYFGGPTNCVASDNPDEDGHNNLQESITGMDPTNAASCFMITNCAQQAGPPAGFLIEWPSVSGRVYCAYWTPALTNSFQAFETNMFYPRNSSTDTVHGTDGKCFYRLDVQLQ